MGDLIMPKTHYICPDKEVIKIEDCLKKGGCRLGERCEELPMLRLIAEDRPFRGVTASAAGNGPRLIYLKAVKPYAVKPDDRMFAMLGINTHNKLAAKVYTENELAEEQLEGGRPDLLSEDEGTDNQYDLVDYKTWGNYAVVKALGKNGKPADVRSPSLQLNRYRMDYEANNFKIARMRVRAIVRDGGTWIAKKAGLDKKSYPIPIPFIEDEWVAEYYNNLNAEVKQAFDTGYARLCDDWEAWEGARCKGYCEVAEYCKEMSRERDETHTWLK